MSEKRRRIQSEAAYQEEAECGLCIPAEQVHDGSVEGCLVRLGGHHCTRPKGHTWRHVACAGQGGHQILIWRVKDEPDTLIQEPTVLVHADGGECHGMPLVDGRCPGCGLTPDMQSVELWRRSLVEAKARNLTRIKR